MDFSASDAIDIWIKEDAGCARFTAVEDRVPVFEIVPCHLRIDGPGKRRHREALCEIARRRHQPGTGWSWTSGYGIRTCEPAGEEAGKRYRAILPLRIGEEVIGWMLLHSSEPHFLAQLDAGFSQVTQTFGIALVNQRSQAALRERVKELTCLYSLSQLSEQPGISLDELMQGIAELLPPGWQYPEITIGKIVLDGRTYSTSVDGEGVSCQIAGIVVAGEQRGRVEVIYREERAHLDEGPFLKEERKLINAIAREIAVIIDRRQAAAERARLQEQLLHADRLATIGQLAAGVAHELNEPLAAVLGFAQLARKASGLREETSADIGKIEAAALHAREIVKKLMIFARQAPPRTGQVNLNQLVEDSLYFLASRCAKNRIEIRLRLDPDLPVITADPSQLQQVLVNLVVNAIQAMGDGGCLTIATTAREARVVLRVEDTGNGMSEEVAEKIFLPFFTTKDVNEGTGLGLAVVHGIVTAHLGTIRVRSEEGVGTRFTIELPFGDG